MADTPKHSVSVAGVVVNDAGQILVIQRRDNRRWEAPGGVLKLNESFENGVRREVFEETGIRITVGRLTGVYKNMRIGVVALVFRCTPALPRGDAQPQSAKR
jgi:8-oxo-dGTP diphosphatase